MNIGAVTARLALIDRLTAPGQEFELAERVIRGIPMRVYVKGPRTLREIALAGTAFGDRTFLVYRGERWTYAEYAVIVAGLARSLREEYGLREGARVVVSMRNLPEWSPIFFAAAVSGLVLVPLNSWWTASELCYAISDSGAQLVVADTERTALLVPHLGDLGRLPLIEVRGGRYPARGVRRWGDLLAAFKPGVTPPEVEVSPDDDATILYTSGTTGRPKGAIGTHRNHCTNLRNSQLNALVNATIAAGGAPPVPSPYIPQSGTLCTFPLFHIGGITCLGYAALSGGKLALQYKWDRTEARELIRRERLTSVLGVPTVTRQLVEDAAVYPKDFVSLVGIGSGGAPVPPDLVNQIGENFNRRVSPSNGYGLTETTSAVVFNTGVDYLARPNCIGRCQPGADVRVVDPARGEDVTAGEIGELWFRGPTVVRGYWNNPEATAAAFTSGWFHTGDLGRVVDGWIYVLDRMKDVIIRGGENIYCAEVEAALFEHPAVEDSALVGVAHPVLGEEAVAVVVPRMGMDISEKEVRRHLALRLAAFKVPVRVVFQSEPLPRTSSGKVLKRDLRSTVVRKVGENQNGGEIS